MFSKDTFRFLEQLKSHNNRPWFEKNKDRFESAVKEPTLELLEALREPLKAVSRHVVVDPRPAGGSMLRIYRDIRFSKDKTPYKTHVAAMMWHEKGKGSSTPGYYLHVEPGNSMVGGGVWHPEPKALKKIRDRIAGKPAEWRSATSGLLKGGCSLIGDSLKRPPAGYDSGHAFIEDIKRKDFGVSVPFTDAEALSPRFADSVLKAAERMKPFMAFLATAVGVPF